MEHGETTSALPGGLVVAHARRTAGAAAPIVLIHGFGSAKEHFRHAFAAPELRQYPLLAPDLVGFGRSRGPEGFGYTMAEQARTMLTLLDELAVDSFHLCAHSMGGLVALELAELEPERVLSLVDVEGNLTPEDCFFSGRIAALPLEEFAGDGRKKLEQSLRMAGWKDPAMREYLETFRRASTVALYRSAADTVAESNGPLVDRLARVARSCYVYGEKNRGVFPGEKMLLAAGVPVFYVPEAGHSMATENPAGLFRIVGSFIAGAT
jgi:pimeloyl-ACP methyl ester carboxylesterase